MKYIFAFILTFVGSFIGLILASMWQSESLRFKVSNYYELPLQNGYIILIGNMLVAIIAFIVFRYMEKIT